MKECESFDKYWLFLIFDKENFNKYERIFYYKLMTDKKRNILRDNIL